MHPVKSLRLSYFAPALCCLFALTALLASSTGAWAQSAGPGKRRTGQTPRAIREGSAAYLRHYEPSNMLRLAIALTPPHPTEEKQFLDDLQNKNSPVFHQYLSAEEWTNRFGPTAESEKAVVDWAESQGLKVTHRYHHRLAVDVEGTVATIEKALNVTINRYELPASATEEARTVFSNDSDPVLPPQIDALVTGVMGLNSVEVLRPAAGKGRVVPQPDYVPGPSVQAVGGVEQAATAQGSAAASPTSGSTPQSSEPTSPRRISGARSTPSASAWPRPCADATCSSVGPA